MSLFDKIIGHYEVFIKENYIPKAAIRQRIRVIDAVIEFLKGEPEDSIDIAHLTEEEKALKIEIYNNIKEDLIKLLEYE